MTYQTNVFFFLFFWRFDDNIIIDQTILKVFESLDRGWRGVFDIQFQEK